MRGFRVRCMVSLRALPFKLWGGFRGLGLLVFGVGGSGGVA